jgi:predicted metal-dependent peptidase
VSQSAVDKIIKARVALQKENPFFSYLAMALQIKEFTPEEEKQLEAVNGKATMGVDKYGHCFYSSTFVESLTQDEVKAVLCHEVLHIALDHLKRIKHHDPQLSNICEDIVINDMLNTNQFHLPKGGIIPDNNHSIDLSKVGGKLIKDIDKKIWEEIYAELEKVVKKIPRSAVGFADDHMRDDKEDGKGGQGDKESKGNKDGKQPAGGKTGGKEEVPDWKRLVNEAYAYAKMQGKEPAGMDRYIDELNQPKINWRQQLIKYLMAELPFDYTYTRPSKHSIATGVFMPAVRKENIELAVAIDTSGSMSPDDLQDCLSEVLGIVTAFDNIELTVLTCDAAVHTVCVVNGASDMTNIKMKGGGGTDFKPVFKWLEENKPNLRVLVFLTDGYGDFPKESDIKTLWVISKQGIKANEVPFGDVIKMEEERE